jgi:hypothetical protein
MILMVVERETRCYVDISFSGIMDREGVRLGDMSIRRGGMYGADWRPATKTLVLRMHPGMECEAKRVWRGNLPGIASMVMLLNGLKGYLMVFSDTVADEPYPTSGGLYCRCCPDCSIQWVSMLGRGALAIADGIECPGCARTYYVDGLKRVPEGYLVVDVVP